MRKTFLLLVVCLFLITGCTSQEEAMGYLITEDEVTAQDTSEPTEEIETLDKSEASEGTDTEESDSIVENADSEESDTIVEKPNSGDVVTINEKMFLTHVTDIYVNAEEYIGKTIQCEGMLLMHDSELLIHPKYFVVRNGPGCCGDDGYVGFEIIWEGEYPEVNEWIEVKGVLESDEFNMIRLTLDSLEVLEVRGEETVSH